MPSLPGSLIGSKRMATRTASDSKESGQCPEACSTIGTSSYVIIPSVIERSLKNSPRGRLVLVIRTDVSVPIFAGNCTYEQPFIMV